MRYYPVNLNLEGKRCIVVGGGPVAERRVLGLIECRASVTVISPKLTHRLRELSDSGTIRHIERPYRSGDLKGAYLVLASTNKHRINRKIGEEARAFGILANIATAPSLSDFTLPSVIRRGDFMVTLSTGGKSPALSRRLRIELEGIFGEEYGVFTEILWAIRERFRKHPPKERKRIYVELAMSTIPRLLREKRLGDAEMELKRITGLGFNEIGFQP
ncbi:MAG TPA: bifunctional precorrin-2 dehydrogenase/sirohydrochlorin ferrochelatase [Thermodesulfobacteriota bacterium]|nr:bifunctional precorrin-2 dehydrogenase/sirohydrochlorin ferrochelatase [Thermodesulfobacteriota bacterium]